MTRHLISVSSIYKVIASTLAISVNQITEELSYQSIAQWDSMGHINIMLALEKEFDLKIDQDQVLELTTVKQIVIFVLPRQTKNSARHCDDKVEIVLHRGLNNVFFDESHITFIDAVNSKLFYRGYDINDLVSHASYEEVAYLLIYGELPNQKLLNAFIDKIRLFRNISEDMATLIKILANQQSATSVLRTLCSVLSEALASLSLEDQGIAYIAKMPIILGMYFSFKNNVTFSLPPNDLSQAAYLLYMLLGKIPDKKILRIFEQNMILQAEHDSNASTFSARIAASTEAELGNSITAAIATFSGGLHGGALLGVVQMLDEIQDEGNVKHYIQDRLQKKLPIFGFGHRVYRSEDPRAEFLKINAKILSDAVSHGEAQPVANSPR